MTNVTSRDIEVLVELFDKSKWDVLKLETAGVRIHLSKNAADGSNPLSVQLNGRGNGLAAALEHGAGNALAEARPQHAAAVPVEAAPAARPATTAASDARHVVVRAPNLGTFYRSPKPGAPPYVEIGQEVDADADICLIEVMKLFTTVRAGMKGIVREVCVADSEMVEGEQTLFLIEPLA